MNSKFRTQDQLLNKHIPSNAHQRWLPTIHISECMLVSKNTTCIEEWMLSHLWRNDSHPLLQLFFTSFLSVIHEILLNRICTVEVNYHKPITVRSNILLHSHHHRVPFLLLFFFLFFFRMVPLFCSTYPKGYKPKAQRVQI